MKLYASSPTNLITAGQVKRNFDLLKEMEYQRELNAKHKNFLVTIPVGSETFSYTITDVASESIAINLALFKCARERNQEPTSFARRYRSTSKAKPL